MAKKTIHHIDFDGLVELNRQIVSLSNEPHGYSEADGEKLKKLLEEVEARADASKFEEAVPEQGSLLVFKLAAGQHFKGGNKRTAMVAGLVFLRKNGFKFDIQNQSFAAVVDKAGMGAAGLEDVHEVLSGLIKKSAVERKGWEATISAVVESNKEYLTKMGT